MHPALSIPELVSIIAGMARRGDACRMARTCRAWYEVALDHIWRILWNENLDILFRTLPSNVYRPLRDAPVCASGDGSTNLTRTCQVVSH